jgi:hypothetical protein
VLNDRGEKLRRALDLCHSSDADERRYAFDVRMKLPNATGHNEQFFVHAKPAMTSGRAFDLP